MMTFRKAWNLLAFIGFVKKSAMLSAVRTKGTSIFIDSTMSRMKKWRRLAAAVSEKAFLGGKQS